MKKTNAEYQARFRKKQEDEKKRVNELIKNYTRDNAESSEKLLVRIKRAMRDVKVDDKGDFRAEDKYKSPNTFVLEGLEYLVLMLKNTAEKDKIEHIKRQQQMEINRHKEKMNKIKKTGDHFEPAFIQ